MLSLEELEDQRIKLYGSGVHKVKGAIITSRVAHTFIFFLPMYLVGQLERPFKNFSANTSNIVYESTGGIFGLTAVDTYEITATIFDSIFILTILYCLYKIIFGFDKNRVYAPKPKRDPRIREIDLKIEKIENEEYPKLDNILARDYWNVAIINKLIEYLSTGRADTRKEALNLFESEKLHNKQVENAYWHGYYSGAHKK